MELHLVEVAVQLVVLVAVVLEVDMVVVLVLVPVDKEILVELVHQLVTEEVAAVGMLTRAYLLVVLVEVAMVEVFSQVDQIYFLQEAEEEVVLTTYHQLHFREVETVAAVEV